VFSNDQQGGNTFVPVANVSKFSVQGKFVGKQAVRKVLDCDHALLSVALQTDRTQTKYTVLGFKFVKMAVVFPAATAPVAAVVAMGATLVVET
jgi:hypothetical protein